MGGVPPFRTWQRWIRRRIEFAVRWAVRTSSAKTGATALPTMSDALAALRRECRRLGLLAPARVQPSAPPPGAPKSPPRRPVGALRTAAETIVRTQVRSTRRRSRSCSTCGRHRSWEPLRRLRSSATTAALHACLATSSGPPPRVGRPD